MREMKLEGKVAVITGAGRGIGKATALLYASEGAKVVCAARTKEEIDAVAAEVDGLAVQCDVASETDTKNLMDETLKAYGRIDILVNNAGNVARDIVHELPVEEWDRVMNVTLRGVFLCSKFALPAMIEQKSGRIITISSGSGKHGYPRRSAYSAAKHGVIGLTDTIDKEYRSMGIRAHIICPDATATTMRRSGYPTEDHDSLIQPEDIADAALYLATLRKTAHVVEIWVNNGLEIRTT
jgi:3-oxoacyl-[acyl-carrier protein] reductase